MIRMTEITKVHRAGLVWPGNVRELQNRIQRATLMAAGPVIEPADLGLDAAAPRPAEPARRPEADADPERAAVEAALRRHAASWPRPPTSWA